MTADNCPFADLKALWLDAFDDPPDVPEAFFATGFSTERFQCVWQDHKPVSALYWFDCTLQGQKIAYIYAAATAKDYRGRGLFRQLMAQTHETLVQKGYAGVVLVPGCRSLYDLYEKLGYRTVTSVAEFDCDWADTPVTLQEITPDRYAALRQNLLPEGGLVQEKETLDFWQTQGTFYAGADFLLAASVEDGTLAAQELLGNTKAAPMILRALNIPHGQFRAPGTGRPFAMFLPLDSQCPVPAYLGLALD